MCVSLSTMCCMQTTHSIAKKELSSFFHQRIANFLKSCRHERMKAKNSHKVSQVMFCFFAKACHGLVEEQKWQICPPCSFATTRYYNTMQLSTRQSELGCSVRYSVRPTARLDKEPMKTSKFCRLDHAQSHPCSFCSI